MECKEIQAVMIDYLDRGLDMEKAATVRAHLIGCEECKKEVEELRELLLAMADQEMRKPGPGLRENFQMMLQSEVNVETADGLLRGSKEGVGGLKEGKGEGVGVMERDAGVKARGVRVGPMGIGWMVAAAVVLLVGGFLLGRTVSGPKGAGTTEQLTAMHKEIKDMKEVLLYSLIDDESASQRIKAVSYAEAIPNPDQKVIDVLVGTLNHDKSVNVRLAALYSLATFADRSVVKDSLVASLPKQTEPLIQVMLINLLAAKKEKRAIGPLNDILSNSKTLPVVQDAARRTLKTL